jgi:hypothetical protein
VCFQKEKLSLGIFYLRAVTNSSGHCTMDTPTSEIEGAEHLTVHGQFMPLERYAGAGLHVWHDRLHALAMSFPGTSVQFIRLQVNEDNKWYAPSSQLDALSEWCAQTAPQKVPPMKCEPYEGVFVTDRGDKGLTTDISRAVQCRICEATMPRVCMRTHVGQHLLRKECVKGQEEISLATACGFCGDRVTCSTQVVMRNKRTHALVTLMISDCPSQPAKLRWNTLAKKSASSPCTNHPVRCPLCTKTIWSYCMAQHYADVHDTARHPDLMHIAEAEQEAVLNWVPHKGKKKNRGNAPAEADDAPFDAAALSAPGDVASSSSSLPPLPLPQSKPPAPPLPSESEATTSGAERSRPLKSVGKRNKKRRDEAQRELQPKRARQDSSSSSSEGELFKDL